jgi:hypothetical protein
LGSIRPTGFARPREYRIDKLARSLRLKRRTCHQSSEKDRAKERKCCQLGIDMVWEIASGDALGNNLDKGTARFGLETVVEFAKVAVTFCAFDERRDTCREGGTGHNVGNVTYNSLNAITRLTCVYRKPKPGRSDGEVRQEWRVI